MNEPFSPSLLIAGAILFGMGLYLIQRGRFLVPALMHRIPFLGVRPKLARALFLFLMMLGVLAGGLGCRILLAWLRG